MAPVLLVIPCFRERERLPRFLPDLCQALSALRNVKLRVVDDGSGPEEQEWLREYVERLRVEFPRLDAAQLNPLNLGKGGAIYSGWDRPETAERLAFADADGAVPAQEILRVLQAVPEASPEAVFAVRTGTDGTRVTRSLHRRIAGAVFRFLVRRLFRFPLPDTQCGFKVIPAAAFTAIRADLSELRFTFDVDLTWHLLRRGFRIVPLPINWTESPGTRLRAGSVLAMYRSLKALRRRLGDWRRA